MTLSTAPLLAGLALLWSAGSALAAETAPTGPGPLSPSRVTEHVDVARLSEHIRVLASDAFQGRGPATPGEDKTIGYIASQFKAAGLLPGGDKGGWTQAVPLRRFETPGPIAVSFSQGGQVHPLTELDDIVVHDENVENPTMAYLLSRFMCPAFPEAFGVVRNVTKPTYDELQAKQAADATAKKGPGDLMKLFRNDDLWTVE